MHEEPENHLFEKEHHLPNLHFSVQNVLGEGFLSFFFFFVFFPKQCG